MILVCRWQCCDCKKGQWYFRNSRPGYNAGGGRF